jgi:uncharacterized protein YkwD
MVHDVHNRRRTLLAAIGVSAAMVVGVPGVDEAEASGCSGARATTAKASPGKLRNAMLCVINRKRASEGLGALKLDKKLQKAAGNHARDMVRHDYFAHQRSGGPDLTQRLDRVGWNGSQWGENIAYGCGSSSSPKATLKAWLNSPPHRAILLSGTYQRGGLGLGQEAPCGSDGAMWVLDVGRK